jgi:CheY-like chemotaxis protein
VTEDHTFLAGKRCLVLEDEFLIALDVRQTLESAGAVVTCFGDAAEALRALQGGAQFDLAVLDLKLSGSDSTGVAALLTERATPFVFLTGMRPDDVRSFPHAPVVEKPYKVEMLMGALRKAASER